MTGLRYRRGGGYRIETSEGALEARRVVLAPGLPPAPMPEWAKAARGRGLPLHHLFEEGTGDPVRKALLACNARQTPRGPDVLPGDVLPGQASVPTAGRVPGRSAGDPVAVVGGGISAAQVAIRIGSQGVPVVLLVRHPLRIHRFDADPGWLGPRYLASFHAEPDPGRRRASVDAARHRGSMTEDDHRHLQALVHRSLVEIRAGEPVDVQATDQGGLFLRVVGTAGEAAAGEVIRVSAVLFATGLTPRLPPDHPVAMTGDHLALPFHSCGTPRLEPSLAWAPGLYLSGRFADLVVGPVAGNLAGARMAADRILATEAV